MNRERRTAIQMLVLCTALWAVSFPTMKALATAQASQLPGASSWFLAALCVVWRFGLAGVVLGLFSLRCLPGLTRLEWQQGLGLGLFGGGGILLQLDGLTYTHASTSAFLTQCYALLIPLWFAWRQRRWPAAQVTASCLTVVAGVAVLSDLHWRTLHLGRGEVETLLASILFAGQILWLERPEYAANHVRRFSVVMFLVMAALAVPVALVTTPQPVYWLRAYATVPNAGMLAVLIVCCTFGGYLLMNAWQRHVTATEAGLIYCLEPVFASLLALVLPGILSRWAGIDYPNEQVTRNLLIGGGLITVANLLVQLPLRRRQ